MSFNKCSDNNRIKTYFEDSQLPSIRVDESYIFDASTALEQATEVPRIFCLAGMDQNRPA
jgi:hypothetical protein